MEINKNRLLNDIFTITHTISENHNEIKTKAKVVWILAEEGFSSFGMRKRSLGCKL